MAPRIPKPANPILQRVKKLESRVDGHDRELAHLHAEKREQDTDIATLADVVYRTKVRDRLRLAKRLRAARGRGR